MLNKEYNIIDAHVHAMTNGIDGADRLAAFQEELGYKASNFLSCECMHDATQNAIGIYLKLKYPMFYAFGGFHYRFAYNFQKEAEQLIQIGFDGMKMVENKPNLRKDIGMASNDQRYDEFYAWMEQNAIPMTVHVADPEEFWDETRIPSWAVESGYYYGDGTFVALESIYEEILDVFKRFPKLKISMAHLLFMSNDRGRLTDILMEHPNVMLDITAGTEMYFNFAEDIEGWRNFFIQFQDRIMFGTDNMNLYDKQDIAIALEINRFEQEFLIKNGVVPAWDQQILGIGLPKQVVDQICVQNFLSFVDNEPKKINCDLAYQYLDERLEDSCYHLSEYERNVIQEIKNYVKSIINQ